MMEPVTSTPTSRPSVAVCGFCGKAFSPRSKAGKRWTETCSLLCGNRLRGQKKAEAHKSECAVCKRRFTAKAYTRTRDGVTVRTRTCSVACGTALRWKSAKRFVSSKKCEQCKKTFSVSTVGRVTMNRNWDRQRFCGYACVYEARRNRSRKGKA